MPPPAYNETGTAFLFPELRRGRNETYRRCEFETGMRVASRVANLPSQCGHARPLGSRIIRYVRDGRTDGRTNKSNAYCPLPYGRGDITAQQKNSFY